MGRIQSSIGLITGTDIAGTVDQLIALSARPRDRLLARTETLQRESQAIAELTASVIGVQLASDKIQNGSSFRSKSAESSNSDVLSAEVGTKGQNGSYVVRTLSNAGTHNVRSLQRFDDIDTALGFDGSISLSPKGGFIDETASLADLNGGRGVEPGSIRITDRSGASDEINLSDARTIDDVLQIINDANIDVRATTTGNSIQLIDESGGTSSNLRVEQLGLEETAADLGLFGIDSASNSATGFELELPASVSALRGVSLNELGGGSGLGTLTDLDIELADGTSATIDLSSATTTAEVIDAIDASGLALTVKLNDARNGFQIRDVSGGSGNITISSTDDTAASLGIAASTTDDIVVGSNLNRQTVTTDTLLADLNQGVGVTSGSFTVTDSAGVVGAVNLTTEGITTVGGLVDAINALSADVTATINDAGDGITVVDNAGGSETLTIADSGNGTAAADLGIAGEATDQTVGGSTVSALVGTQAGVVTIEATDTLEDVVTKINEDGRYGDASIVLNDDGSYSLQVRSKNAGEGGKLAINTSGFELDLRTDVRGQDALIAVSLDGGAERFVKSADGVFDLSASLTATGDVTSSTKLTEFASGTSTGSFKVTDSEGNVSAVNIAVEKITTVGELIDSINNLGLAVTASINEEGTGINIVDTADGSGTLTIEDTGNGTAAARIGIAGQASEKTVNGVTVDALIGLGAGDDDGDDATGLVLTLKEVTSDPITITVEDDTSTVVSSAKTFVDQYNLLAEKLDSLTFFDEESSEVGLLFGSSEALRIRNNFTRLLSGRITGAGEFKSIGQVGIKFDDKGRLQLDQTKLKEALTDNRLDVEAFFTTEDTGLAKRLDNLADSIAGASGSLLINRTTTLRTQIDSNNLRVDRLNSRLEIERERLLTRFYKTEEAISKLQSNQSAIAGIERITIPT